MDGTIVGIGITIGGIVLNAGIIYGVSKTSMKNISVSISKIEKTQEKFGERLGKAESDINSRAVLCDERHK